MQEIKHIKQPENSNTCGHYCVAMITGKPLEDVIKVIGHTKGTYTREIVAALQHFGLKPLSTRLKRFTSTVPATCIVKMKFLNTWRSHWILVVDGWIYDPACDFVYGVKCSGISGGYLSSYLEIQRS